MNHLFFKVLTLGLILWCVTMIFGVDHASADSVSVVKSGNCVKWTKEARFVGMAYNHLVHLHNRCKKSMICEVTTDVNPKPTKTVLTSDAKTTILTFRGSPAREFEAKVTCKKK